MSKQADERAFVVALLAEPPMYEGGESPRDIATRLGIPEKRAAYICEKWTSKGWYDYGVNVTMGWLTPAGREYASLRGDNATEHLWSIESEGP